MPFLYAINVVFNTLRIFELLRVKVQILASESSDRSIKLSGLKRNNLKSPCIFTSKDFRWLRFSPNNFISRSPYIEVNFRTFTRNNSKMRSVLKTAFTAIKNGISVQHFPKNDFLNLTLCQSNSGPKCISRSEGRVFSFPPPVCAYENQYVQEKKSNRFFIFPKIII